MLDSSKLGVVFFVSMTATYLCIFIIVVHVISFQVPEQQPITLCSGAEDTKHYEEGKKCVEELALYLKPLSSARGSSCIVSFENESWTQIRCKTTYPNDQLVCLKNGCRPCLETN